MSFEEKYDVDIKFVPMYKDVTLPEYAKPGDSGADVKAYLKDPRFIRITPGNRALIPTGLRVAYIKSGCEIQARPRSGLALKFGLTVLNTPGTIDSGFRGELGIVLINHDPFMDIIINHGDRIAQIVVCPVLKANFSFVDEVDPSSRGAGGFGHTDER